MEVTIYKSHIKNYNIVINEHVTKINWLAGPLIQSVIDCFPNLKELYCWGNQLINLDALTNCSNLIKLNCHDNNLTNLDGLINCINLRELFCSYNQLTNLDALTNCTNLQKLYCYNNRLTNLNGLTNCIDLQELHCNHNLLTNLDALTNCINLWNLCCYDNQLTNLNPIVYFHKLKNINYNNNELDIQSIQVQRFLQRMRNTNIKSSIYLDKQNVHDITIQRSVCDSIQSILSDPKPDFNLELIIDSNLESHTKNLLLDWCADTTIHSHHLITYAELLSYVWQRILKSEHKLELLKILNEQVSDAECKCFTGRFNRTLSTLVGFYPDIKIEISDQARIGAIIIAIKNRIKPYDTDNHIRLARKELLEAGYSEDEITLWLDAINE